MLNPHFRLGALAVAFACFTFPSAANTFNRISSFCRGKQHSSHAGCEEKHLGRDHYGHS